MLEGTAVMEEGGSTAMLTGFRMRLANLRPLLEAIPRTIWAFYEEQFATEGAYGGSPWKPLAPGTVKRLGRMGLGTGHLLRRTGTLYASLTREDARYSHVEVTNDTVEVGTTDPVAGYLMSKRSGGPRVITPDPLPETVTETWAELTQQYLAGLEEFNEDAP